MMLVELSSSTIETAPGRSRDSNVDCAPSERQRRSLAGLLLALLVALLASAPDRALADGGPRRIVSINLCADQLLYALVPRERIAALSFLAADPDVSPIAEAVAGVPLVASDAEEVLAYDPDLVIDGAFSARPTTSMLERLGRRVERVGMSSDLEGLASNIRAVAAWTKSEPAGEALLADLGRRLAAAAPAPGEKRPRALVWFVGSLASGRDTLADLALAAAGFENQAASRGLVGLAPWPLELLVSDPPDLIVLGNAAEQYRTVAADNLRHPALVTTREKVESLVLPPNLLICDGPAVVEAIERLAAARRRINAGEATP